MRPLARLDRDRALSAPRTRLASARGHLHDHREELCGVRARAGTIVPRAASGARCFALVIDDPRATSTPPRSRSSWSRLRSAGCEDFRARWRRATRRARALDRGQAVADAPSAAYDRRARSITYLDPDIQAFDPLEELDSAAGRARLVLIPHLTEPIPTTVANPSEADILIAGVYNLGSSLAPRPEVDPLLDWWSDGSATIAGRPRARVLRGPALDGPGPGLPDGLLVRARPRLQRRLLEPPRPPFERDRRRYLVDEPRFAFLHFSGFDPLEPHQSEQAPATASTWSPPSPSWPSCAATTRSWSWGNGTARPATGPTRTPRRPQRPSARPHHPRRLPRRAEQEGALTQSVFSERKAPGGLLAWLNSPAPLGGREQGVTRYLAHAAGGLPRASRGAFPGSRRPPAARASLAWARVHGRHEVPIRRRAASPGFGGFQAGGAPTGVNLAGVLRRGAGRGRGGAAVDRGPPDTAHRGRPDRRPPAPPAPREDGLALRRPPSRASRST